MAKVRKDLSEWIIHFVHDRGTSTDPYDWDINSDWDVVIPTSFDYNGTKDHNTYGKTSDPWPLDSSAKAFHVLRKILGSGYIRAGWSFRETKTEIVPTIYGPKPAVCFTEMPLNHLLEYVNTRNNHEFVAPYAIAFKRQELFRAGARPVIYGVSTIHKEAGVGDPYFGKGLRVLAEECGIGLKEQYRYVYTNMSPIKNIDWTHEREWRWADIFEKYDMPGLPFLLGCLNSTFTEIIILVQKDIEVETILDDLKSYYDAGSNFATDSFRYILLEACKVISFETLKREGIKPEEFSLDTLPKLTVGKKLTRPMPSEHLKNHIQKIWEQACTIFYETSKKALEDFPHLDLCDICGFAEVVTYSAQSETTQALLDLDLVDCINQVYYVKGLIGVLTQSLSIHEAAARATAKFLTESLDQDFYMHSNWD